MFKSTRTRTGANLTPFLLFVSVNSFISLPLMSTFNNNNNNNDNHSSDSSKLKDDSTDNEHETGNTLLLQQNDPDWDHKLATLFSIFENAPVQSLHRALISANGDLEQAIPLILSSTSNATNSTKDSQDSSTSSTSTTDTPPRKKQKLIQPRLSTFLHTPSSSSTSPPISNGVHSRATTSSSSASLSISSEPTTLLYRPSSTSRKNNEGVASNLPSIYDRLRWKDGIDESSTTTTRIKPLILYKPDDVAKSCPCTLVFNVLPKDLSNRLLEVMLKDAETWNRNRWWLFERMVESPHKTSYFAEREDDLEEVAGWTYNGKQQDAPRQFLPEMIEAKTIVRQKVNELRKSRTM